LHPIISGIAEFANFKIPKFGLEIGLLIFQTFIPILGQTCRNSGGRIIAQKKLKLWCVFFLCAAAKEKNIKKIFEKKSQEKKKSST
jgi:hypothetical protein